MTVRRINNSEITTFNRCPRKWYLSYYRNLELPREQERAPLYVGSAVHAALDAYYRGDAAAGRLALAQYLGEPDDPERIKSAELATLMYDGYLEWLAETGADAGMEVVASEQELEAPLGIILGREVVLHGRVDLMCAWPDGTRTFMDHKTTDSFAAFADRRMQLAPQLLTYALLHRLNYGWSPDGATYNMLRKVKRTAQARPPFYARETVRFNNHQLRSHYHHLRANIERILYVEDMFVTGVPPHLVYPVVDQDCTWRCDFLPVCPLLDDGSDGEGMLLSVYRKKEVI